MVVFTCVFCSGTDGSLAITSVGSAIVNGPQKARCSGANIIHDKEHFNNTISLP